MNWTQFKSRLVALAGSEFKQLGGKFKQQWAQLTDDDLMLLEDQKDAFLGKLQERTGLPKDEAESQLDAFIAKLRRSGNGLVS